MEVISIECLGIFDDYVYDLETEDGTFIASSNFDDNGIVCKNTDSCYVTFDIPKQKYTVDGIFDEVAYMKENFRISAECAHRISTEYKHPIKLEFEKIMLPFFIYKKKRYAYVEWLVPEISNEVEYKGLSVVRRDFCEYVSIVCKRIFRILMHDKSIKIVERENEFVIIENNTETVLDKSLMNTLDGSSNKLLTEVFGDMTKYCAIAVLYTRKAIYDLLITNSVSMEHLMLSKSIRSTYSVNGMNIRWDKGLCSIHNIELDKGSQCSTCDKCKNPNHGIKKFMISQNEHNSKSCKECSDAWTFVNSPHVVIANRLRKDDPINGPRPPDRIDYVYYYVPNANKLKQYEFVSHPSNLNGRKLHYLYYFEHQLQKSIDDMYEIIFHNPQIMYKDIIETCKRNNIQQSMLSVTSTSTSGSAVKKFSKI